MAAAGSRGLRSRVRLGLLLLLLAPLGLVPASQALDLSRIPVRTNPDINEFTPVAEADWFAWSRNSRMRPGQLNTYVQRPGRSAVKVNPSGTESVAGGGTSRFLVYAQWDATHPGDIWRYDVQTGTRRRYGAAVNTRQDEFHPSLSGRWLLFGRYNYGTGVSRVLLLNTGTGGVQTLATGVGDTYVYSGQVNGDFLTWGKLLNGSSMDIYRKHLPTGAVQRIPRPVVAQYHPMVGRDGTVFYTRSGNGCGLNAQLVRYPVGGPAEVIAALPNGVDTGFGHVTERAGGARDIYIADYPCARAKSRQWDIHRVVDSYTLTVTTSGTGTGDVASTPTGIGCPAQCSGIFPRGRVVTLTATPDEGSQVTGWSVAACGWNPTCAVTVKTNQTVSVDFAPVTPP